MVQMKIGHAVFELLQKISNIFSTEEEKSEVINKTDDIQINESEDVTFEADDFSAELPNTLKLTQNPRKLLKGIIARVLDPDYGSRAEENSRHLLQTVMLFRVPVFRRYFAEELQACACRQLSAASEECPSVPLSAQHIKCNSQGLVEITLASWDLLRYLLSECLKEALAQADFEGMSWLIHLAGFFGLRSGLLVYSLRDTLRGHEALQQPEVWVQIFETLALYEEQFWKDLDSTCQAVFGMSAGDATLLAIVLRMRSSVATIRWLGLHLDLEGASLPSLKQRASSFRHRKGNSSQHSLASVASDGGWWGDCFFVRCNDFVGEQLLDMEDKPLAPEAVIWALDLLMGTDLKEACSVHPAVLSKEELMKGLHCNSVGFCPLLELLRTVTTAAVSRCCPVNLTPASGSDENPQTSGQELTWVSCFCGRRFLPWKMVGNFTPKENATGNFSVVETRLCEQCYRSLCSLWPREANPLGPFSFSMGSAVFPFLKPQQPSSPFSNNSKKQVADFFTTCERIQKDMVPKVLTLKTFVQMLKKGFDVNRIDDDKASLFAWAKPKSRVLFLDQSGKRLCWILKGRERLEPESNKTVPISALSATSVEDTKCVSEFVLWCNEKRLTIEAESVAMKELLIAGFDALLKRLKQTGETDTSKF